MGFILPERNFEDNFEGLMLFALLPAVQVCVMVLIGGKVIALNMVLTVGSCGDRGSFSLGVLLMLLVGILSSPPENLPG